MSFFYSIFLQLHAATVNADVTKKVEGRLTKTQREYLLRQQMAAIREELGEGEDAGEEDDLEKLRAKLLDAVRLLPIRPRSRGARRSLRTFPVVNLHPRFPFNV